METHISDTLPLAALTIGQARQFIRGLVSQELEALKPQEPPRTTFDRMNAKGAVQFLSEQGYPITVGSLYNFVARGDIPYLKVGKRLIFSREQLIAWMENRTESESPSNPTQTLAESANRKRS